LLLHQGKVEATGDTAGSISIVYALYATSAARDYRFQTCVSSLRSRIVMEKQRFLGGLMKYLEFAFWKLRQFRKGLGKPLVISGFTI
jgi:hypothetical protein